MIHISSCPSTLAEGFDTYSPTAIKRLFGGHRVSHILSDDESSSLKGEKAGTAMRRISVSGAQEKFPAVIINGKIHIADENQQSTHILKPYPWDEQLLNKKQIPANEHLTMQIASQVYGIITADNGLCFTEKGQPVYITRRFDIKPDLTKTEMEDFATLVGKNEQTDGKHFKYAGCYEDIAKAIRKFIPAWMVDMERFLDLVVFNYIYANGDDHLKNFSVIRQGRDYRLAPAYDLLNTSLHIVGDDFGLDGGLSPNMEKSDTYENSGHPCREDFERFGALIGLPQKRVCRLLDRYMQLPQQAQTLTARSFLNEKMKRTYLRIVNERIARFNRH